MLYETSQIYGHGASYERVFLDLPAGVYVFRLSLEESAEPLALEMTVEPWP